MVQYTQARGISRQWRIPSDGGMRSAVETDSPGKAEGGVIVIGYGYEKGASLDLTVGIF